MKQALISIIIPVFNVEKYLKRCIDSAVNQTYKSIEIILINDGSTDNSGTICDEYAKQDNRIKVIHQKNLGVSAARNTGLNISKGECISFIDSDDFVDPKFIEILYQSLIKYKVDICMCECQDFDEIGIFKERNYDTFVTHNREGFFDATNRIPTVFLWDKLFKRKVFNNFKFPVNEMAEDISLLEKTVFKYFFAYISTPLYFHFLRKDSLYHNPSEIFLWAALKHERLFLLTYCEHTFNRACINHLFKRVLVALEYTKNGKNFPNYVTNKKEFLKLMKKDYKKIHKQLNLINKLACKHPILYIGFNKILEIILFPKYIYKAKKRSKYIYKFSKISETNFN